MNETEKPIGSRKLPAQRKFMSKYSKWALISLILWPIHALAGIFSMTPVIIAIFTFYPIPLIIGVIGEIVSRKASIYDEPQINEKAFTLIAFVSAISPFAIYLYGLTNDILNIIRILDNRP